MLFSAGTFLYVATVHVLPELTNRSSGSCHSGGGSALHKSEICALVLGALLPALLTTGHHH